MARKRQPENDSAVITNGIVMVQRRLLNDVYSTRHRTGVDSTERNQFLFNGKPQASLSTTVACGLPFRNSPEITSGLNELKTHAVSLRSLRLTCHTLQITTLPIGTFFCRV